MPRINRDAVMSALVDKGWNGRNLAREAKLEPRTVYKFIRGEGVCTPRTFKAIGDALGVRPSSLIQGRDDIAP